MTARGRAISLGHWYTRRSPTGCCCGRDFATERELREHLENVAAENYDGKSEEPK